MAYFRCNYLTSSERQKHHGSSPEARLLHLWGSDLLRHMSTLSPTPSLFGRTTPWSAPRCIRALIGSSAARQLLQKFTFHNCTCLLPSEECGCWPAETRCHPKRWFDGCPSAPPSWCAALPQSGALSARWFPAFSFQPSFGVLDPQELSESCREALNSSISFAVSEETT